MCRCIFWGRSTTLGDTTAAWFRLAPVPRMRSGTNGIKESNHLDLALQAHGGLERRRDETLDSNAETDTHLSRRNT